MELEMNVLTGAKLGDGPWSLSMHAAAPPETKPQQPPGSQYGACMTMFLVRSEITSWVPILVLRTPYSYLEFIKFEMETKSKPCRWIPDMAIN